MIFAYKEIQFLLGAPIIEQPMFMRIELASTILLILFQLDFGSGHMQEKFFTIFLIAECHVTSVR